MSIHVEGCWYPIAEDEARRYAERWPNHCGYCDGNGGFASYDSDTGDVDVEPCDRCLQDGKCPRCAGGVISEAYWDAGHYAVCDNCSYIENRTPGAPTGYDWCSCIEDQMFADFDDVPF